MSPLRVLCFALMLALMPAMAFAGNALSPEQKAEVESIVRELLVNKEPEIIIKAAEAVQGKMEKAEAQKGSKAVMENYEKLTKDPNSPVGGNPKGNVTVVEFFDYSCGYCKKAQRSVEELLAKDKNVRLIYKDFPILGPGSTEMAKAAVAASLQGKYIEFHNELMDPRVRGSKEMLANLAKKLGMDVEKFKKDMESDKVKDILKENRSLGNAIGIRGTPSFVIGTKFYPGALTSEQFEQAVAEARQAKGK